MADKIGTSEKTVQGVIDRHTTTNFADLKEATKSLEFELLKDEFTAKEVEYFTARYAKLMSQFKDNIIPTEETQLQHLIKIEILMRRSLIGMKKFKMDLHRKEKQLVKLYAQYAQTGETADTGLRDRILKFETVITAFKNSKKSTNAEFVKLQEKHASIMRDLKVTRDQRITKLDHSTKDFMGLMKLMQEADFRKREALQQSKIRLAVEREKQRLGGYHQYRDGTVDRPLLTEDTVEDKDNVS